MYEEEILRNPYSLRLWWRYLQDRKDAPAKKRYLLFERAIKSLPGSYKVRSGGGRVILLARLIPRPFPTCALRPSLLPLRDRSFGIPT